MEKRLNSQGVALAIGIALGAIMFAVTSQPIWIGVGLAMCIAIGIVLRKE